MADLAALTAAVEAGNRADAVSLTQAAIDEGIEPGTVLDAMTDGGLGIAFFSPLSNARYFLPARPLTVSPIGLGSFLSSRGLAVMKSEILWIWLPTAGAFAAVRGGRMLLGRNRPRLDPRESGPE